MRSKEVEEAINGLNQYIEEDEIYKENKPQSDFDEFCIKHCKDIDTVLAYIEKLEELPNKIRDKIKELEEEKRKIESSPYDKWDLYKVIGKIEVLKSIIGE